MRKITSLDALKRLIPDEKTAIEYFMQRRWLDGAYCPYCGHDRLYHFWASTRHKCRRCGLSFSIKVGTIFEETKVPLRTWILAIWHLTATPAIPSTELAKELGVSQKTAWLMMHRLYQASRTRSFREQVIDDPETDNVIVYAIAELTKDTRLGIFSELAPSLAEIAAEPRLLAIYGTRILTLS
jgi:transposase-like protein